MGHSMCYCYKCKNYVFYDDNWNIYTNTCEKCAKEIENIPVKDTNEILNNILSPIKIGLKGKIESLDGVDYYLLNNEDEIIYKITDMISNFQLDIDSNNKFLCHFSLINGECFRNIRVNFLMK